MLCSRLREQIKETFAHNFDEDVKKHLPQGKHEVNEDLFHRS